MTVRITVDVDVAISYETDVESLLGDKWPEGKDMSATALLQALQDSYTRQGSSADKGEFLHDANLLNAEVARIYIQVQSTDERGRPVITAATW